MNKELVEDTQKFLRDLDSLLIHIAVYVIVNIILVIFMFSDFSRFWWVLLPMIFWSLLLIYHAMQMAEKKGTSVKKLILSLFIST